MKHRKWQRFVCSSTCLFLPLAILPQVNEDGEITTVASWYGPGFHGKRTASGEVFDQNKLTAASKTLPFGTKLRVRNLKNGKTVTVVINDRGPFIKGRGIDLSKAAAKHLGIDGIAKVSYATIPKFKPQPAADIEIAQSAIKPAVPKTVDIDDAPVSITESVVPEDALLSVEPETVQPATLLPLQPTQLQSAQENQTSVLRSSQLIEGVDAANYSDSLENIASVQGATSIKQASTAFAVAKAGRTIASAKRSAAPTRPNRSKFAVEQPKITRPKGPVAKPKITRAQILVAQAKAPSKPLKAKQGRSKQYLAARSSQKQHIAKRSSQKRYIANRSNQKRYVASARNQRRNTRDKKTYYVASAYRKGGSKFGRTMHKLTAKAAGVYRGIKGIFAML